VSSHDATLLLVGKQRASIKHIQRQDMWRKLPLPVLLAEVELASELPLQAVT